MNKFFLILLFSVQLFAGINIYPPPSTVSSLFGTQSSNTFFAGPTTGDAATPAFRLLNENDMVIASYLSVAERILKDSTDQTVFDWGSGELKWNTLNVISLSEGKFYDGSGTDSIDAFNRKLISNRKELDWDAGIIKKDDVTVIDFSSATDGTPILGTTIANSASSGYIGEYVTSSVAQGSAVSSTTGTPKTITSISLTPGDWDLSAIYCLTGSGTATNSGIQGGITTTTNSFTGSTLGASSMIFPSFDTSTYNGCFSIPPFRVNISATSTRYLVANVAAYGGMGTGPGMYGSISARRIR